jgi:hypothetical protein
VSFHSANGSAGQRSDGFMVKAPCGRPEEKGMVARGSGAARGVVSRLRKPLIGRPGFSALPAMEIGLETLAAVVGKVLCKGWTIRGLAHEEGIRCLWK